MEIGDLDLVGLETTCSEMAPESIIPQQFTLLEYEIIKAKEMNSLGFSAESLKDQEGKKK